MHLNKVKEILQQYPYIAEDMQEIQREMQKYIEMQEELRQTVLKAQQISDMPKNPNASDPTLNAIIEIMDKYQQNIDRCIEQLRELDQRKKWLDKAFATLTEEERRIVYLRYNKNTAIRKIAYHLRISKDTIYRRLREIEQKISRII